MILRTFRGFVPIGLMLLILASVFTAVAAANTVPSSRLGDQRSVIDANALKPPQCSALNLTSIYVCPSLLGGSCDPTGTSELVLGTPFDDDIKAGQGDDCILGGGGNDRILGQGGTDVCIGGPGTDAFGGCETAIQ